MLAKAVTSSLGRKPDLPLAAAQAQLALSKVEQVVSWTKRQMEKSVIDLKQNTVETIARGLFSCSGLVCVPYHKTPDHLLPGPNGTVTMEGCCRTREEYDSFYGGGGSSEVSACNLMLAMCDDARVLALADITERTRSLVDGDRSTPEQGDRSFQFGVLRILAQGRKDGQSCEHYDPCKRPRQGRLGESR